MNWPGWRELDLRSIKLLRVSYKLRYLFSDNSLTPYLSGEFTEKCISDVINDVMITGGTFFVRYVLESLYIGQMCVKVN